VSIGPSSQTAPAVPVRIMFVMPTDPERMRIGGINSFLRGFVKFAPDDFELALVGISDDRPLWQWASIEFEGRALRFLPVVRWRVGVRGRIPIALRFVWALFRHRRRLKTHEWILSFHRPGTDLPFRGRRNRRWRVVHLAVEDLATQGSESRWRRLPALLRGLERRSFRQMDRVYVVNDEATAAYRARFPEVAHRIEFLPNWADPEIFFRQPAERRDQLRAALGRELELPAAAPLLLFAGRLEGQKDPLLLAHAVAVLRRERPDARLLVVGEGTLETAMRQALTGGDADGASRFLKTVSRQRLAELMNVCDAMAISSAFETGPTVGLEALACGLPVVSTPVGEVARLVASSGAGRVTMDRSPEAMAAALHEILTAPREAIAETCLSAVAPRLADRVLGALYATNRELAGSSGDRDEAAANGSGRALLGSRR
jgi:glycosyltransferase involved in cell wall biosynthesis